MYPTFRSLLFKLDPERAHALTLNLIRIVGGFPPLRALVRSYFCPPGKPVKAFGLLFPNPIGLAAGYDKDGLGWRGLACLGFGHIEVGTVTPIAQPGNPKPRLFRLTDEQALINRMGFPGLGADFVAQKLWKRKRSKTNDSSPELVLGVNLGKNKVTTNEAAVKDYLYLMHKFAPLADYLAINISSPNTTGLRQLQARHALNGLLTALTRERLQGVPILVKLAPDLTDAELDDALDVILDNKMDGVIATNTTISRPGIVSPLANESGGLSGAPIRKLSTIMIEKIYQRTGGTLPIIGVGGVSNITDLREKLDAGAILVQLYTGLIYKGPGLVKQLVIDL
jgi:dihydroorotate dehydrogenase